MTSVTGAQTLLRALDILDAFAEEGASLTLADLGRRAGLTAPTTHRLVKALVSRGFLVTDASRRYSLGPAVMRLASVVMHRTDDLAALSMPTLERLRELTGETASLHCLLGNERICVAELVSPEPIRMQSDVGRTYPIHAGAAGKAILAWQPDVLDRPGLRLVPGHAGDDHRRGEAPPRAGADPPARLRRERVRDRARRGVARRARARRRRPACSPPSTSPGPRCAGTAPSARSSATRSSPRSPR